MRRSYSTGRVLVIIVLTVLVAGNAVWCLLSGRSAPWIAVAAYGAVAFAVLRSKDYRAGLIAGIAGFVVHAVELVFRGTAGLGSFERAWLAIDMILPLVLAGSSWSLIRSSLRSRDAGVGQDAGGANGGPGSWE